jgi:hypothetical protein
MMMADMTREQLLAQVGEAGQDAGADYDDGLDGWFGWTISDGVLTATFEPSTEGDPGPKSSAMWRLVPAVPAEPGESLLDDGERWQVQQAREVLASWTQEREADAAAYGRIHDRERVLADHAARLLSFLDRIAPPEATDG